MNKHVKLIIILVQLWRSTLGTGVSLSTRAEIIDVTCDTDGDCKIFKNATINSTCVDGQCHCAELTSGNETMCKPVFTKTSNQIGGQCPCVSTNSHCNEKTQICVCNEGFLPSREGKKCISKSVPLGSACEIDEQCISHDHFSHCDDAHHNCTCKNHLVMYQNKCHSIVVPSATPCTQNSDCSNRTAHSICHEGQCLCDSGFVANAENTTCLEVAQFEKPCLDSNQCIAQLSVGSLCSEGKCLCNEMYFPFATHHQDNATAKNHVQVTCKRKVTHGESCNNDGECYQFHRGPHEQTMECFMNECVCTPGYIETDGICVSTSGASQPYATPILALALFVTVFFM